MEDQKKLLQFITWLGENVPELKDQAPEQIVSTINQLSESKEGQQMLQGLIEEFESNMTSMFKKGGKLGYLLCLKKGGSIKDCGCGCKKIEKGQQGIPNLEYNESTKWMDDKISPRIKHSLGRFRSAGSVSSFEPSIVGRGLGLQTTYDSGDFKSYAESPKDYLDRHKNFQNQLSSQSRLEFNYKDPGIALKQDGGRVLWSEQYPYATRRDTIKAAMDEMGFSRAQARLAYKNQKNALRNAGFSGKEMLQNARYNIIDTAYPITQASESQPSVSQPPVLDTNFEIEDVPIEVNDTFIPIENKPLTVEKIDKFGGNFNDAFAAARRSKLDSFVWDNPNAQYERYSTQLGKTTPSAQQQEYEYNQKLVENAVNSPKLGDKVKSGILSTLNYPMK